MTVQKEQSHNHASPTQNMLQALNKQQTVNIVQSEFIISVSLEGRSRHQEAEMASHMWHCSKARNGINEQNLAGNYYTVRFHKIL